MGKRNSWGGTILSIYDANESLVTLEDALKKADEAVKGDSAMSIAKAMTGGLGLYFGPGADTANAQAILDKVPEYVKFVGLDRRRSEAEAAANKLGGGIDRVLIKLGGLTEADLKNWSVEDKVAKLEELCSKPTTTTKKPTADPDLKAAKDEAKRLQKDLEAQTKRLEEAEAAKVASDSTNKDLELYGDDRLKVCLNKHIGENAEDICKSVKQDVDRFYSGAPQFDDITELSLQFLKYSDNPDYC